VTSPPPPDQAPPPTTPEDHQAAQVAIALAVAYAIAKLWPSDPARVRTPAFKAAVAQEVIAHAQASATLAVRQYAGARAAAGVSRPAFRPVAADAPSLAEIGAMVDEALAGVDLFDADALAQVQDHLATAAGRMATETGARTITENVGRDRAAQGYARIPEGGACSFCLMLATRGPVYKHDRAGGRGDSFAASNAKFTGPGTIKVHNHCDCHPEPVFNAYEAPARVRAADALYAIASERRSGKAARDAYRAAIEGFTNDAAGRPYFTDDQLQRIAPLRAQL
jgi:hypothetical protein